MSLASVHPVDLSASQDRLSPRSPSVTSLEELQQQSIAHPQSDAVLTIEGLRAQLNSCFTCGVSWAEEHVTLDCSECGGYALQRPCPLCSARCGETWERDRPVSHAFSKAAWLGVCPLSESPQAVQSFPPLKAPVHPPAPVPLPPHCSAAVRFTQDLCQRLEKLSAQERPS